MVIKLLLLQFQIFGCDFVNLARKGLQRNSITLQTFSLACLCRSGYAQAGSPRLAQKSEISPRNSFVTISL